MNQPSTTGKSILWVEEEVFFIKPLLEKLTEAGFAIKMVRNPQEAVAELATGNLPTLVIINTKLPAGHFFPASHTRGNTRTGVCLYHVVRKTHPRIPVVIYTSSEKLTGESLPIDERRLIINRLNLLPDEFREDIVRFVAMAVAKPILPSRGRTNSPDDDGGVWYEPGPPVIQL